MRNKDSEGQRERERERERERSWIFKRPFKSPLRAIYNLGTNFGLINC